METSKGIEKALAELKHDIARMDRVELLAFGRLHRVNPDSVEYREARAEWQLRLAKKKDAPLEPPPPHQLSSEELAERAKAAGPGRYPWMRYPDDRESEACPDPTPLFKIPLIRAASEDND
jgi:hypothetical protein